MFEYNFYNKYLKSIYFFKSMSKEYNSLFLTILLPKFNIKFNFYYKLIFFFLDKF